MPKDKLTVDQFAEKIKAKYPAYEDRDNSLLVEKFLAKHPIYSDRVDLGVKKKVQSDAGKSGSGNSVFGGIGDQGFPQSTQTKPLAPTVLSPEKQKEFIEKNKGYKAPVTKQVAKPQEEQGFLESTGNTLSNIGTKLKGFIPHLNTGSADILGSILGKEATAGLFRLPRIEYDANGGFSLQSDREIEDVRNEAYHKLAELEKQIKPTQGIVDNARNFNIPGLAAGVVDAMGSLVSTAIPSVLTGGAGLYTETVGDAIVKFNSEKAKSKGISVEELYKKGDAELGIPAAIGTLGGVLEGIGLKGASNLMMGKLKGTAMKKVASFMFEVNKEGVTEWVQAGLETANTELGKGTDELKVTEKALEVMFSKKGLEAYVMGVVGSGAAGGVGKLSRLAVSPKAKQAVTENAATVERLQADLNNTNVSPEAKAVIAENLQQSVSNIATAIEEDTHKDENLSPQQKQEVDKITASIDKLEVVAKDPSVSKETVADAENKIAELNKQVEAIEPNSTKSGIKDELVNAIPEGDNEDALPKALTEPIKQSSLNIRGMYKEPSNWENSETLSWKQFIDDNKWSKDYKFFEEKKPVYKDKNSLMPDGETVKYYMTVDGKNKREIPKDVFDYQQNINSEEVQTEQIAPASEQSQLDAPKISIETFQPFIDAVNDSKNFKDALKKVENIADVPKEVADAFRKKYDPNNDKLKSEAFADFYNEVKGKDKDTIARKESVQQLDDESDHSESDSYIEAEKELSRLFDDEDKEVEFYKANGGPGAKLSTLLDKINELKTANKEVSSALLESEGASSADRQQSGVIAEVETKVAVSAKFAQSNPKAGDPLRSLADKIEQGKISKLKGFKASSGFDLAWDGSLTVIAETLRTGAKLADAIEAGLAYVRKTDWYKGLEDKGEFDKQFTSHIEKEYEELAKSEQESEAKKEANENVSGIKKGLVSDDIIASVNLDKIKDKEMHELGQKIVETGEINPKGIVDEIVGIGKKVKGNRRALQPKEVVALIYYKATLDNKRRDLLKERNSQFAKGEPTASADVEISKLEDDITAYDVMAVITAQQQSLAFRLRRGLLDKDYNLVSQIEQYKKVNKGYISPEIEAKFKEYDKELTRLKEEIAEAEQRFIKAEEEQAVKDIAEDIARSAKTKKSVLTPQEQARKRELAKKYRVFNDISRVATIWFEADFIEYARLNLKESKGDFKVWAKEMLKTVGVESKMKLPELYERIGGKGKVDLDGVVEKPFVEEGELVIPSNFIRDLVEQGVTDINGLTEAVQAEVQKDLPDITPRQVRDAITKYGKTVNRTADALQQKINEAKRLGRLYSQLEDLEIGKKKTKDGKEYSALSEKERELKRQINILEKTIPKTQAEAELDENQRREKRKEYLKEFIREKNERLDAKNFAPKSKPSPVLADGELAELEAKAHEVRGKYDEAHFENEQANRTGWQKFKDGSIEWTSGLQRALQAGLDFSALGVQGIVAALSTNPVKTYEAIKEGFKFMASENYERTFLAKLKADPLFSVMEQSGLALQFPNTKLGSKDYQLSGSVINKIWEGMLYPLQYTNRKLYERAILFNPYRATERAYTGVVDTLRVQLFKQFAADLKAKGITFESDPRQYEIAANAANNITFRGRLRFAEPVAKELAVVFFAPRKITATLSLTNPGYWGHMWYTSPVVAKRATLKMATFITVATTLTLAIKSFRDDNDEDENPDVFNPVSNDFMKLRIGNTRIDLFGGLNQNVILFAREFTGNYKSASSSKTINLGENAFSPNRWDLLMRFSTNKFSPLSGVGYRILDERKGQMFDAESEMWAATAPIWTQGIDELRKEHPETMSSFLIALSFFGVNMNTYGTPEFLDKDKDEKLRMLLAKKNVSFFEKHRNDVEVFDPETFEKRTPTKDEFKTYKQAYGEYIKGNLKSRFSEYAQMTVQEFEKEIGAVKKEATEAAKEAVSGVSPKLIYIKVEKDGESKTYQLSPKQIRERQAYKKEFIAKHGETILATVTKKAIDKGESKEAAAITAKNKLKSEVNAYSKDKILKDYQKGKGEYDLTLKAEEE
jgi:hypothetical protein